ncbi:CoA transferase [Paracoccus methylarcula]|uniref:Carnitine dehydratase n=1 Tax=Paracoccus methylarcula TaxID=72022 RepID=A0A422QWF6_9RHOB|nr:CoA transferase [Paracoccus methylarcula]RNF34326.1 carnitine dehydratase [Paracoccus methylarcula]
MNRTNNLPLAGVRILDLGQQIAAPACAMILADLGANVVHVDPPQGPAWDHPANAILNRNKKILRLDLGSAEGRTQLLSLIDEADVVIENFQPGELLASGIDLAMLRQQRPELITVSLPGFASNDTLRREWKATEAIIAATAGAFTDMGFNRVLMGLNPSFSPLPLGSAYATTLTAASVALALNAREETGRGDAIEVPVVAALMEGLSYNSYVIEGLPERYKTMRELEIEHRKANGIEMDLGYEALQEYLDPFYRTYECADGRLFYCVCPSHRNHAKRALTVLGIYDELIAEGLPEVRDLHAPIAEWDGETSIGVYPLPKKWADIISEKMKRAFKTKTSEEWGRIFGEGRIPGAPHRTTREWVNDAHTHAAGLMLKVEDPEYGEMIQPGPVVWLESCAEDMLSPAPREMVDYETALAWLQAAGPRFAPVTAAPLPDSRKPWLEGVRVLDLTNVIAGPHSTAFLTRFGAEVTKLDPVTPLYDPLIGTLFTFQTGMGKRSALVDIMSPEGREVFNRLLRNTDIVVINAPERQLEPLGLDQASLSAINPRVIFSRLDCFGGPHRGPKTDYIGYDDIIQANSGIMSRFGGEATPEEHAHLGTLDVNCGFAGAVGVAVALYHQRRTGQATRPRTSLSAVTNLAQIPFAFDYDGRAPFNEPSGRQALGHHALSRFYRAGDGWLYLDCSNNETETLDKIPGLEGIARSNDLCGFLETALSTVTAEEWAARLRAYGIAAAVPNSIENLRALYSREADGTAGTTMGSFAFSIHRDHPSGHCLTQIDHYAIRPSEVPIRAASLPERWGHSTREVLANAGYSDAEITALIARNVVSLGWAQEFLPS